VCVCVCVCVCLKLFCSSPVCSCRALCGLFGRYGDRWDDAAVLAGEVRTTKMARTRGKGLGKASPRRAKDEVLALHPGRLEVGSHQLS
jgi:hypothetical protein